MKKTPRKKLTEKIDKLWSLKVRSICQCELCGKRGDLKNFDAHHIKGRSNESTRYLLANGVCLCKGCHRFRVHMDTFTTGILIDKLKVKRGKDWWPSLEEAVDDTKKYKMSELEEIRDSLVDNSS